MNHSKWNVKLKIIWNYFLACLIAIIVMIPFLWMLSTSLKSKGALMQIPIEWIPQNPTLDSYRMVFSRFPFLRAILNSFFITCSYTVVTILSASMAAFAFTKIQFPYGNTVFKLYLASMMIPTQVTMIPLFVIEAAELDGAGLFRIYRTVVLPLSGSAIATLTITTFMESWNDYLWPLLMLNDKNKMTLTLALNSLNGQYGTEYNILMAGSLLSMIPIVVIYALAQKYFKEGLMAGGVKG